MELQKQLSEGQIIWHLKTLSDLCDAYLEAFVQLVGAQYNFYENGHNQMPETVNEKYQTLLHQRRMAIIEYREFLEALKPQFYEAFAKIKILSPFTLNWDIDARGALHLVITFNDTNDEELADRIKAYFPFLKIERLPNSCTVQARSITPFIEISQITDHRFQPTHLAPLESTEDEIEKLQKQMMNVIVHI